MWKEGKEEERYQESGVVCVCSTPLFHKRSLCRLPKLGRAEFAEFANKKSSYVGAPSQIYLFFKMFWILKMVTE